MKYVIILLACAAAALAQDSQEKDTPKTKEKTGKKIEYLWREIDPKEIIAKSLEAVSNAVPKAAQDPTRPVFHFRPPAQWMNDVCGAFFYKGYYHVFYQFNPWEDAWNKGLGWGHARSKDLVRWECLPPALLPDRDNGSQMDASGSAFFDDKGKPVLFFAKTPDGYPDGDKAREQWAAVPEDDDLIRWRRVDIGLRRGESGVPQDTPRNWADMFVFQAGGRTFATMKASKGLICEAVAPDLLKWEVVGKIKGSVGECPNIFPLGDRHVMIVSVFPISYRTGEFDANKIAFNFRDKAPRVLDYSCKRNLRGDRGSRGLYGTTVFTDAKGRAILLGFIDQFLPRKGWNNCMSLPRVLTLDGDNLIQTPLPELRELRGKQVTLKNIALDTNAKAVEGVPAIQSEVTATFKAGTAKSFGLKIAGVKINCDANGLDVAGIPMPYPIAPWQSVKLHAFFDRTALELFVDDGKRASTRVVYPENPNLPIELFAESGMAEVLSLEAWEIKSIW